MHLNKEQLTHLFNEYLRLYVIPGSSNHLPLYETRSGGIALTNRLYKILRDPAYYHTIWGDKIDILEVFSIGERLMKKTKKVFIVGLNHWFTKKDIEVLKSIYQKDFV